MKELFTNKPLKYLICLMVITQGILLALLSTNMMDSRYADYLDQHPEAGLSINLKTIPREKSMATYEFLTDYAAQNELVYLRKDFLLDKKGIANGIVYSVEGDVYGDKVALDCDFLGENIINQEKLAKLLTSSNDKASLGLETSSLNQIATIPQFTYGNKIIFKKLLTTVESMGTINGSYRIFGLDEDKYDEFLSGLSQASGIDYRVFIDGLSGHYRDDSFKLVLLMSIFIAHSFVLVTLLIVVTINYLPKLGNLLLQGWSRTQFILSLYQPILMTAFASSFLFCLYGLLLTDFTFHSTIFLSLMLGIGLLNFIIISIFILLASCFILIMSPINAIRGRVPRKAYMLSALVVYAIFNVLLVYSCYYLDGPMKEIAENVGISQQWEQVSDSQILRSVQAGEDHSSFTRQSKKFFEDFYHWYQSIADEEGVYLINTTHMTDSMIENYCNGEVKLSMPNEDFWIFRASPNYLSKIGVTIDEALVEAAQAGKRVYLIPESKSKDYRAICEMMQHGDLRSFRDDDIQTVFTDEKGFEFATYQANKDFFTWTTTELENITIKDPVILITTPNNMRFKESESLSAIGLANSYIKFDKAAADKFVTPAYLDKFSLADNKINFLEVERFVDGLQKDLWITIQWFSMVLLGIAVIVILLLITFITIFENSYQETIFIKKFMGYSNFMIYKWPFAIIFGTVMVDLFSTIILRSKIGIIFIICMGIIQFGIGYRFISKNQIKKLNSFFKS